jgi:uncharacterized membrane protein HdeD (DUF308 family)
MEVTFSSKWIKAFNGLGLVIIAILLMACPFSKLVDLRWLIGLIMIITSCVLLCGWYVGAKKDGKMAAKACLYLLFAIVFFSKKFIIYEGYFFVLWVMLEGLLLVADGVNAKKENNDSWALTIGVGILTLILAFVAAFTVKGAGEIVEEAFMAELQNAFSYRGSVDVPEPKMAIMVGISFIAAALGNIMAVLGQNVPKIEVKKEI